MSKASVTNMIRLGGCRQPNFRLLFSSRSVYANTDSRTYPVQLQVKAE